MFDTGIVHGMLELGMVPFDLSSSRSKATLLLSVIGVGFLLALVLFIMSIVAQRAYDTEALPSLGVEDDDNGVVDDEAPSAFHFGDDDDDVLQGGSDAAVMLGQMRADNGSGSSSAVQGKRKRGMFGSRKKADKSVESKGFDGQEPSGGVVDQEERATEQAPERHTPQRMMEPQAETELPSIDSLS